MGDEANMPTYNLDNLSDVEFEELIKPLMTKQSQRTSRGALVGTRNKTRNLV